jgi:flagellar FliL protein
MAEEKAEETEGAAEKRKSGRTLPLVPILAVAAVLAGGAGAWLLGLLPFGRASAPPAEAKEEEPVHDAKPQVGALHAMDSFIANLSDEDGKRYLKITIQVEFFDPRIPDEFNVRAPQIRDLLLTLFSSKTFAEIRTPEGKGLLREEIINRMNRAMHKDLVKAVYFTEFIVQ